MYCTETRPYNQGARLTAYELVHDKIPATLIVDSMVAALMKLRNISAVVVGADRVSNKTAYQTYLLKLYCISSSFCFARLLEILCGVIVSQFISVIHFQCFMSALNVLHATIKSCI